MTNHSFHHSILRAYDIRGIYQKTLFEQDAFYVGKCFAAYLNKLKKHKIVIASDGRTSSPILKKKLIEGLLASGVEIIDIGVGPTPMLYFAVYHLKCHGGIMITGSHNPKDHNGFKMMIKNQNFYGAEILKLGNILQNQDFVDGKNGTIKKIDISQNYVKRLLQDCELVSNKSNLLNEVENYAPLKKLRIAWDNGNGSAGEILQQLTKRIDAEHFLLYEKIDGNFPNHHPDPTEEKNLQDLINCVKKNHCDVGIDFDGDGDRIGVVDDKGQIIWGDQLLIFYALDILKHQHNATIIGDVKASSLLFNQIKKAHGNAIMWKTGHSLIKAKMKEENASVAGEMSGHIFFADKYYGFDDALYAAIRLINILIHSKIKLSQMLAKLPKTYASPEFRIETSEEQKFKIVEDLKKLLQHNHEKFIDIDGIRMESDLGWWLIRASNTQPVLVARCEGTSLDNLKLMKNNLRDKLKLCNLIIPHELH